MVGSEGSISITLLAVSLIACQNNKSNNNQDAKILQLEEEISQPSKEKVIEAVKEEAAKVETKDDKSINEKK